MLLKEEMSHILEWKSEWWRQHTDTRTGLTGDLTEGIRVYAQDQADVQIALHMHFCRLWEVPLQTSDENPSGDDDGSDSDDNLEGEEASDVDDNDGASFP